MHYVNTGSGKLPLITLLGILSVSLTVNLPGLAISPILGKLDSVFGHVSELETQLLTVLPNVITIPFILFSGKLSTSKNQIAVLGAGLAIYAAAGIMCLFATTLTALIWLSCLLGVGCGLVIPLAASLISQHFTGSERTRQLGNKSSLSNFTVIFATLFVGWVGTHDWHLSFLVYLVPLLPLALTPFMTRGYISRHTAVSVPAATPGESSNTATKGHRASAFKQPVRLLAGVMGLYFISTYGIEVVSYYLPFTMGKFGIGTSAVGIATAMFFLAATFSGFFLTRILGALGKTSIQVSLAMCVIGLYGCTMFHSEWSFIAASALMGLGYGIIQPVIYDKTAALAPTAEKSTEYFGYLLTCNYIGISLVPFIISFAGKAMHQTANISFPYLFNAAILGAVLLLAIVMRKSFVFNAGKQAKL